MQFVHVPPARIADEWPAIAEILAPAVREDPRQTMEGLRKRLVEGADQLVEVTGPGRCLMVIRVSDELVCWTKYLSGHIEGGPKARLAIMRDVVRHLENVARDAGCTEHRLCGRDWSTILPDYEPFDGLRNGLKKELRK